MTLWKICDPGLALGAWRVCGAEKGTGSQRFHQAIAADADVADFLLKSQGKPAHGPDPPRDMSNLEERNFDDQAENPHEVSELPGVFSIQDWAEVAPPGAGFVTGHPLHNMLRISGFSGQIMSLHGTEPDSLDARAGKGAGTIASPCNIAISDPDNTVDAPRFLVTDQVDSTEFALPKLSHGSAAGASLPSSEEPVFVPLTRSDALYQPGGAGPTLIRVERFGAELQARALETLRDSGQRVIQIRLDPVELGRVRIVMRMTETGLQLQFTVERPETLDLMRRFATDLLQDMARLGFSDLMMSFSDQSDRSESAEQEKQGHREGPGASDLVAITGQGPRHGSNETGGMDLRL